MELPFSSADGIDDLVEEAVDDYEVVDGLSRFSDFSADIFRP